jgi:hypothetical protein
MDDLDRTFIALKKVSYETLISKISNGPVMNPVSFVVNYTAWSEPICIANGWTLAELNRELHKRTYDYK